MDAEITIKNYRCFPDSFPARFSLKAGFTAFVGSNNAGKSSLLRFFYEFRDLFHQLAEAGSLSQSLGGVRGISLPPSVAEPGELFYKGNDRSIHITIDLQPPQPSPGDVPGVDRIEVVVSRPTNSFTASIYVQGRPLPRADGSLSASGQNLIRYGSPIADLAHSSKVFGALANTLYIGSFRNALNIGSKNDYYDIQIGQAFISAWRAFKTGTQAARNEAAYQVETNIGHIFGYDRFQFNAGPEDTTLQMFIDGRSFKLGEVGAGMAQFMLVLANAAIKKPNYILIDEPELNLHPSLQIDFLTSLASYASEGTVFATHSLGLARATASQIYSLRKQGQFETRIAPLETTSRLSEFLGEMSFGGYQELGFKQVLLVEGPTDLISVQQLLRLLKKDHQVVLLQLGGNTLINGTPSTEVQLQELTRISSSIAALVDSERTSPGKALGADREAFRALCERVGVKCHVLDKRAIENYWTERAVHSVTGPDVSALGPFEELAGRWAKAQNWRIAREMTKDELMATDMGTFLESL